MEKYYKVSEDTLKKLLKSYYTYAAYHQASINNIDIIKNMLQRLLLESWEEEQDKIKKWKNNPELTINDLSYDDLLDYCVEDSLNDFQEV